MDYKKAEESTVYYMQERCVGGFNNRAAGARVADGTKAALALRLSELAGKKSQHWSSGEGVTHQAGMV